jgi:hypothetical protein
MLFMHAFALAGDIWPRHYIGGLTGAFNPDCRNFRDLWTSIRPRTAGLVRNLG